MENASKALIMAGGILIGLLILAVLLSTFKSISSLQKTKLTEEEQAKITEFNAKYIKYVGQYVYGTEVASLRNKYDSDKLVEVKLESGEQNLPTGVGQDTKYYKCKNVGYDEKTGRVNSITFEEATIQENY